MKNRLEHKVNHLSAKLVAGFMRATSKANLTEHGFYQAVIRGDTTTVRRYFENGMDVNTIFRMDRPSFSAINQPSRTQPSRTQPSRTKVYALTPLHLAIIYGQSELATYLLEHGANPNVRDQNGETPLHLATQTRNIALAKKLLQSNVDHSACNDRGMPAMEIALLNRDGEMISTLLAGGADIEQELSSRATIIDYRNLFPEVDHAIKVGLSCRHANRTKQLVGRRYGRSHKK